jgi:hypothetical protein
MNNTTDQKNFEQYIEILITYKKNNPNENVYISEKSLKKAIEWYINIEKNILQ